MIQQPGHRPQPTATPAGQPAVNDNARKFLADLESAYTAERTQQPTHIRIDDPNIPSWQDGARIGTAPPIPQPGIPPQSRAAVDYAVRVLSTSVATALFSGSISLIMLASRWADPVVCGIVFGAPIGLAVPIAALSGLAKRTKEVVAAAPPQTNNHYSGHVHQDHRSVHVHTKTRGGIVAVTRNQLPELPPGH